MGWKAAVNTPSNYMIHMYNASRIDLVIDTR